MLQQTTFALFTTENKEATFCDWLQAKSAENWKQATQHPFTIAVGNGTVSDDAYRRYLIEDYAFVVDLASALGYLVAKAPTMEAKGVLSAFLAQLTSAENDYFLRSFEALGLSKETYENAVANDTTRSIAATLLSAAGKGKYEDGLACLLCAEWVYMDWCTREGTKPRPDQFWLAEWIDLHDNPAFLQFVGWLKAEMNRVGPALPAWRQREVQERFSRMCELEAAFFDAVSKD
ncbi:TenA family protein [Pseudovibrio sp. SPO723]|uniref:TenA family protein n=1 Tax=Nesiotobacter zosterae TaxID=392721 RepID=UPI0029C24D2C|nr:TenA family protein [Pseudovibrio sp. SPO723]MDX5594825.1 TenA family protein [Pseudovibrio sp. SPO723]